MKGKQQTDSNSFVPHTESASCGSSEHSHAENVPSGKQA
jgi:hypothetical protein